MIETNGLSQRKREAVDQQLANVDMYKNLRVSLVVRGSLSNYLESAIRVLFPLIRSPLKWNQKNLHLCI